MTRTFGIKAIKITAEMIDSAELSPPSEEVKQAILESGVITESFSSMNTRVIVISYC